METIEQGGIQPVTLNVLGDRVLVRMVDVLESESTIFTAATVQNTAEFGIVEGVGLYVEGVAVGDVVMFGKFSGYQVDLQGEERMVLRGADVVAKVNGGLVRDRRAVRPDEGLAGGLMVPRNAGEIVIADASTPLPPAPQRKASAVNPSARI